MLENVPRAHGQRSRFLSEFALSLGREFDLQATLDWSLERIGQLLDVDRVTFFLREGDADACRLVVRSGYVRPGVAPLPASMRTRSFPPELAAERPLVASDVFSDPTLEPEWELFRTLGTRSLLSVPIAVDGVVRGAVGASTVVHRAWTAEDCRFLETAVRHVATALRQSELVFELGRERDRLRTLLDLSSVIHRSRTSAEVIEAALAGLRDTLGFPLGLFALVSPDGRTLDPLGVQAGSPLLDLRPVSGPPPLSRLVLATDEAVLVNDLETDPRLDGSRQRLLELGIRSVAVLPLRTGGRTFGALTVGGPRESRGIGPDDLVALQCVADVVAVALEQRRATEAAQRSMREAQALSEASRALLSHTLDRDVLLNQLIDAIVRQFGKENCRLLLVDEGRQRLVQLAQRGEWPGEVLSAADTLRLDGPGLTVAAVRTARVVNVGDVSRDPRYVPGWPLARSELVVPLVVEGRVVGVFDMQSPRDNAFSDDDARLLSVFADRAALAIRLADLVTELDERTHVLEAVARATQLLNFRLQSPDLLTSVAEETSHAFPSSDGCVVYVATEDGAALSIAAAYGLGVGVQMGLPSVKTAVGLLRCAGPAFVENRPVLLETSGLDDLMSDQPPEARARTRAAHGTPEIQQLLAVPIRVGDQRLGVLEILARQPRAFTDRDAKTLQLLAEQAAIALRNARVIAELQQSNRLKDDFLANLSHEVRTPLTGIVGWAEVLLDARGDDPETRRSLKSILAQADTLSRMLADLIDLSRIDTFGLQIRPSRVILATTVAAALNAVAPVALKRGVAIRCDVADDVPDLEADPARLEQVVWNLLTNSVKFSRAGSEVTVLVRGTPETGVELIVEDRGFGIDPLFLPFLFERFRQEETANNRRFGGLGIGLSIANAIVKAHGGTIEAFSEGRGRGCRFAVSFPPERVHQRRAVASG